ncbi:MAG: F-box protein: endocytic membrane traffic, recycling ReCYcling 1 [Bathelium mastoideum]|nr:MAG: F-box protein: endocytic membrane traffic, recycling ReCYcling 1 [Bathelium mastoideum]
MSAHKKNAMAGGPSKRDLFAPLRATQIVTSKPVLPAELIATILDYLSGPDLIRFAHTSRRTRDMVYDDTRWIRKLKLMGCWNETEARRRHDEARKMKLDVQQAKDSGGTRRAGTNMDGNANGSFRRHSGDHTSETLFDAGVEEAEQNTSREASRKPATDSLQDGFSAIDLSPTTLKHKSLGLQNSSNDVLHVIQKARSIRGGARQEYGKIHEVLAPYYFDLLIAPSLNDSLISRTFQQPQQQAQMLAQIRKFAKVDIGEGGHLRETKIDSIISAFEHTALREFEHGLVAEDIEGDMRVFASALVSLNGGSSAVNVFINRSSIISNKHSLGRPTDALSGVSSDNINLQVSAEFFRRLSMALNEQGSVINQVFPISVDVLLPFIRRAIDEVISGYLENLFREARGRTLECYLKAVSSAYEQLHQFEMSLKPSDASKADFTQKVHKSIAQCFEPYIEPYMEKELEYFRMKCDAEVEAWEKQRSDEEAVTESIFMSNVNRQVAKSDFLKSFRKVVMMPVNVLPSMSSPFTASRPVQRSTSYTGNYTGGSLEPPSRTGSPLPTPSTPNSRPPSPSQRSESLPTTELAAKAAIMNSKLEGIRSLFSIEVALNLVHIGKSSIERLAVFAKVDPHLPPASKAKEKCETVFILLLKVLGTRHIRGGFDQAVDHLANYKPHHNSPVSQPKQPDDDPSTSSSTAAASATSRAGGVAPLITFLELVNVGDLIQQMVDVFFLQELIHPGLTDADDFLDAAVTEKKRFEQMLDERVAAGLNRGIDALLAEVEFVCATTQRPGDFNPGAAGAVDGGAGAGGVVDVGPSETARRVVDLLGSHTGMLVGATDKNVLDVFYQEVGQRLFTVLCKHLKRQRISVDGAVKLISDINHYTLFITSLRQKSLTPYFTALRELSQIYLIDSKHAKDIATVVADADRYHGVITAEEMYEFAERRADWLVVRRDVERAMYGIGCLVM